MDIEELNQKIKELEYYIKDEKLKRSRYITFLIISMIAILGGGLVLGLLFNSVSKIVMLSIAIGILTNVKSFSEIEKGNRDIYYYNDQIRIYKDNINDLINNAKKNEASLKKVKVKVVKRDYSYKPNKEEVKTQKPEIKSERFTEEGLYNQEIETKKGKSR